MTLLSKLPLTNIEFHEMDMERDWPGISALMDIEEWPFVKGDVELSHSQPNSFGIVCLKDTKLIGFFVGHAFANTGYLDMMIIDSAHRKNPFIGREFWKLAKRIFRENGFIETVAHCTNDSAPFLKLLRYKDKEHFTLYRLESGVNIEAHISSCRKAGETDLESIIHLDSKIFNCERREWVTNILKQEGADIYVNEINGQIVASVFARPRKDSTICLDGCNANSFPELKDLITYVISVNKESSFDCFCKNGSDLETYLSELEFSVPEFFIPIGPLTELRQGQDTDVGTSEGMRTLSWM